MRMRALSGRAKDGVATYDPVDGRAIHLLHK